MNQPIRLYQCYAIEKGSLDCDTRLYMKNKKK